MDSNEQVNTIALQAEHTKEEEADYFIKCKVCKKEIGIIKV